MATISGKIIKGKGLGRRLGFPTLNIPYDGGLSGVFVGKVFLNGEWLLAAVHIGEVCEAYLLDWNGKVELGTEIKVELLKKIRDTKKFDTPDFLKEQISKDVECVRNLI